MNGTSPRESLRGKKSEIREVPLSDIYVDLRFQRAVNPNQLTRIKNEFHPNGVGLVLLANVEDNERPQRYAVIDGQTRWQALNELHAEVADGGREPVEGLTNAVMAEVFDDLTIGEAALLFGLRNNQKPIPPYHRDRILATEGDAVMNEVINQSADAGYIVFNDEEDRVNMPHRTHAKRIVGYGKANARPKLLEEALVIQAQSFGTGIGYLDKDVLQATAELLLHNPNLIDEELVRVMTTLGLPGIRGQAEIASAKFNTRMSKACRSVIADAYNKGKRSADKIRI